MKTQNIVNIIAIIFSFIVLLVIVFGVFGCTMSIGAYERGLWYDHDEKQYNPKGWGIKADIVAGRMVRPFNFHGENPWEKPEYYWDFPIIGPFISISLGEWGMYAGFKSFKNHEGRYDWLPSDADPNNPDLLFTISGSTRKTRWK